MAPKPFDRNQSRGMLLGLAVGDAIGTTVEFSPRGSFPALTDMTGGGPFGLQAGQWTDDTSMALCLADSLVESGGWDPHDCIMRFVRWWRQGENSCTGSCFDIGITTRNALHRFEQLGDPYAGSTDPSTSGNGAIMRLAPVAIAYGSDVEAAVTAAVLQGRTTHASPECDLFADRLAKLLVTGDIGAAEDAPGRDAAEASIQSTGYVRNSWEAAVWAVRRSGSFREAVLTAANLGDDADTVAAIAGQIAGRIWGAEAIPLEWLEKLAWRERLTHLADSLHDMEPDHALPLLR